MVSKILLLVAIFTCQVLCLTEIRLNDINVHYIKHPLIGTSFGIPAERWDDTLVNCNVIFPNGISYSVYPTANHPNLDFMAMPQVKIFPFKSCSLSVRNIGKEYSAFCYIEVRLSDVHVRYVQHPLIGTSFDIPHIHSADTLTNCFVVFPDRAVYSVYPTANHPNLDLMAKPHVSLFSTKSCSVVVRNVGKEYSGEYELISRVVRQPNNNVFVIRRRFILDVVVPNFD
ncbi:unnamed protein product [Colias eurytheme]|nr:unnamed protein product [Colias eurytheme]